MPDGRRRRWHSFSNGEMDEEERTLGRARDLIEENKKVA